MSMIDPNLRSLQRALDILTASVDDGELEIAMQAAQEAYVPEPGQTFPDDPVQAQALRMEIFRAELTASIESVVERRYEDLWQSLSPQQADAINALTLEDSEGATIALASSGPSSRARDYHQVVVDFLENQAQAYAAGISAHTQALSRAYQDAAQTVANHPPTA